MKLIPITQKLRVLESQVNELQSKPDHNIELEPIQHELNNLQSLIIQKDACIQTLEIEKAGNLQNISLLEANIITQQSNCELLTQEKINLNNRVQKLEGEIQSLTEKLRDLELQRNTFEVSNNHSYLENIQVQIAQKDDDIQKLKIENHQNIQRIKQLEINLNDKESRLNEISNNNNIYPNELQKQIAQKNAYIKNLELEKGDLEKDLEMYVEYLNISMLEDIEDIETYPLFIEYEYDYQYLRSSCMDRCQDYIDYLQQYL